MKTRQELANGAIKQCSKNTPPLSPDQYQALLLLLPQWSVQEQSGTACIERSFSFKNFATALLFTNLIGELAEAANHHPAVLTEWGKVTIRWWTHSIGGLHLNDFILAARCDEHYDEL